MEVPQRALEARLLHRQAGAPAGHEAAQRMPLGHPGGQGRVDQRAGIAGAGDVFRLQHLALAELRGNFQPRPGQHVEQARQPAVQLRGGHFEEVVGSARPGAGVQPPAPRLHPGHQPLARGEARAAEEQQVFEEMREPGVRPRLVMAAGRHPRQGGGAGGLRIVHQGQPQAVGQDDLAGLRGRGVAVHGQSNGVLPPPYPHAGGRE